MDENGQDKRQGQKKPRKTADERETRNRYERERRRQIAPQDDEFNPDGTRTVGRVEQLVWRSETARQDVKWNPGGDLTNREVEILKQKARRAKRRLQSRAGSGQAVQPGTKEAIAASAQMTSAPQILDDSAVEKRMFDIDRPDLAMHAARRFAEEVFRLQSEQGNSANSQGAPSTQSSRPQRQQPSNSKGTMGKGRLK